MSSREKYRNFKTHITLGGVLECWSLRIKSKGLSPASQSLGASYLWVHSLNYMQERYHSSDHGDIYTTVPSYTSHSAQYGKPHNGTPGV